MTVNSKLITVTCGAVLALIATLSFNNEAHARIAITVSPMHQNKVLVPGHVESGNFTVSNPSDNDEDLNYELFIRPFFYDDKGEVSYHERENYTKIADWIKIDQMAGAIAPGEKKKIEFNIEVPENAPAGGQYASIVVRGIPKDEGRMINNIFEVSHLIYAEVAGETNHGGRILEASVPGYMFSGNITGNALIENTGNVHAYAKQTLKVFPLFGDEEYYSNEEEPKEAFLMPEAKQYSSVSWDETPSMGIFRVEYNVEFEGVNTKVEKVVIICPIWLLVIILLFIATLIYRIATRSGKPNKKAKKESPAEAQ